MSVKLFRVPFRLTIDGSIELFAESAADARKQFDALSDYELLENLHLDGKSGRHVEEMGFKIEEVA